jgi:hypothetical protein
LSLLSVDSAVWRSCDVSSEATLIMLIDSMEVRNVTVAVVTPWTVPFGEVRCIFRSDEARRMKRRIPPSPLSVEICL